MAEAPEPSTVFVDVASESLYPIVPGGVEEPKVEPDIGPLLIEMNPTNSTRLRCPDCKRYTATTEEKMLRHIRKTHRGENPFQCYMCDYSTYNKVLFEEHVRIHQGIKPFKCSYCPYRSVSKKNTKKHELVHRPDNPRKCDQCGFIARHEKGLKHHVRSHGDTAGLECSICKQTFSNLTGYNSHRKSRKRCPECKSMFCRSIIAKHRLEEHGVVGEKKTSKKSMTKKSLFTCAICQWEGNTKPRILLHLIHHPDQEEEMSSKSSKKTTNISPKISPLEPIITRTKSAQQRRQLRNKEKKTEKPKLTKPEIKSPKCNKPVIRSKEALLKEPEKSSVEVIEQVEYYPNKLKRKLCTKKVMLKPKHNFKVVAATNKRKLATPKRGLKSPTTKQGSPRHLLSPKRPKQTCSSPELSMQDMVRIMEETRSLSDEDFMEILTCPSPVWWEDPPDGCYDEDSIYTRSPEQLPEKSTKETKKRKITKTKPFNKTNNNSINIEQIPEQITINDKKDERFVQKKQKLENILGNIKNKTVKPINVVKNTISENRNRKVSDSEGDISDLSFNEEEILKNLENMDIPIESKSIIPVNIKKEIDVKDIKHEIMDSNVISSKNEKVVNENSSTVGIKSEVTDDCIIVDENSDLNKVSKCDDNLDVESKNIDNQCTKITDVDKSSCSISSNKDTKLKQELSNCSKNLEFNKNTEQNTINDTNNSNKTITNENLSNRKSTDLSEYITIYKIIPEKSKIESPEKEPKPSSKKTKIDTVKGKLNDFFKQCKNNKRVKKSESPTISLTDVKQEIIDSESSDAKIDVEENRLNGCDSCVVKTENVIKESYEEIEKAPNLHCNSCDFLADTKETYRQHVSSCKDVARISWSHNYVLNQT